MRELQVLDERERALGVELLLEHEELGVQHRLHRVAGGRAVVERRGEERAHARLDAVDVLEAFAVERVHLRGLARAAAGCAARLWRGRWCRRCRACPCAGVRGVAGPRRLPAPAMIVPSRDVAMAGCRTSICCAQRGVGDQDLGAAVAQDPAGLLGLVVPVDRAGVGAEQARAEHRVEERRLVVQHDAHHVALADAERARSRRRRGARPRRTRRARISRPPKSRRAGHAGSCR